MKTANFSAESFNPICGDHYWVYLDIRQGIIKDSSFLGEGCLISKASCSLMTETVRNKTIKEIKEIFNFFQKMLKGEIITHLGTKFPKKLSAFSGIHKFPLRIECALLPWLALRKWFDKLTTRRF